MKRKVCKRLLASVLAGTMVLGMSVTAFADEPSTSGSTEGEGAFEGHVEKNVLSVQLPTVPEANPFAYTIDPEGLIAATEGAKDKTATFEPGATVYFLSGPKAYTKDSAKLKVINKGTVAADVTVMAETAANNDIAMAGSETFTGTNAELYLGLKVANQAAVAVKQTGDTTPASVTVGLNGVSDNYQVTYNEDKTYGYAPKDGTPDTAWNSFEFGLTGACNSQGTWSAEGLDAPNVTVTWSYAKRADNSSNPLLTDNKTNAMGPSIATRTFASVAGSALEVTVDLGTGDLAAEGIASITFQRDGTPVIVNASRYTFADSKITFASDWVDQQRSQFETSRDYEVTFDDEAATSVTITITK